jgi:hypothetical protein
MTRYYHNSRDNRKINSVSNPIFRIFLFVTILFSGIYITSCEEDPTIIGKDLLPESDFVSIHSIDTLHAISYTMYDESAETDNPSIAYMGRIYDPYFGTTDASFVSQIRMAEEWPDQPFTIDSVKLFLVLNEVKGTSGLTPRIRMTEIAKQIYNDSTYYSGTTVPLIDSISYEVTLPSLKADTTVNEIEVKLPNSFGRHITRDTAMLFYSNTKPDFRSYFKGLYFELIPGTDPVMVSLSLAPESTGYYSNSIILYMHGSDGIQTSYSFVLDATNRNAAFSKFKHDFNTAPENNRIKHINDFYKDTLSYLQYLNGVYTRIEIPGLQNLKNDPILKNIGVNRARLTIPAHLDGTIYKPSTVPSQLYLRYRTASGEKYVVPDYNLDQYHSFFDGSIDSTDLNNVVYNFNIATFVQKYLKDNTGEILPELEVFQASGTSNLILKANNSKRPLKFEFTYTLF